MPVQSRFQRAYEKHLLSAQRLELLRTLRDTLDPRTTLGQIVDACERLGWGGPMGELSLRELSAALQDDEKPEEVADEGIFAGDLESDEAAGRPAAPAPPPKTKPAAKKSKAAAKPKKKVASKRRAAVGPKVRKRR